MRFRKIRYADGVVTLELEDQPSADQEEQRVITSKERPRKAFLHALDALGLPALTVCELPLYFVDELTVRAVSISYDEQGNRGVVVTSLRRLKNLSTPLVLNTPNLSERGADQGKATMPAAMRLALDALEREARLFVEGLREQADLFDETAAPEDDEDLMEHVGAAIGRTMREARRHARGRAAASPTIEAE